MTAVFPRTFPPALVPMAVKRKVDHAVEEYEP